MRQATHTTIINIGEYYGVEPPGTRITDRTFI
jgi:hypothetical protein